MLVFIVPLQAPGASKDWPLVSQLACRSVGSLLNQTNDRFSIIMVCNEPPIGLPDHPQLKVIQRDFAIPSSVEARMSDKWRKVHVGLAAIRALAPCNAMLVDADDCVNRKLAEFVAAHPVDHGWVFRRGYVHDEGSRLIYYHPREFNAWCGTSHIVRVAKDELPTSEVGGAEDNPILRCHNHTHIAQEMAKLGRPLADLPFAGAVYNVATGENNYGFSLAGWRSKKSCLQKLLRYRPLTTRLRQDFNLYDILPASNRYSETSLAHT